MLKKVIVLIMFLGVILSGVYISKAEVNEASTLTLTEATKIALEHNLDYLKAGIEYQQAILDADQIKFQANKIDEDDISTLSSALGKYVSPQEKELTKEIAKQEYDLAKEETNILVAKSYFDLLKAEKIVEVKTKTEKRAAEELNLAQKKYQIGTLSKVDAEQAQLSYDIAQNDLKNAQKSVKNAQVALNKALGVDINRTYKLTSTLDYEKVTIPSLKDLTKQVLENRIALKQAQNAKTIAAAKYDLAISYEAPHTFTARQYKIALDSADLTLKQELQNAQADAVTALLQIQKTDDEVQLSARKVTQADNNYTLAKRKFDTGSGTFINVFNSLIDLADAQANYVDAVYNYTLAKYQLQTVVYIAQ